MTATLTKEQLIEKREELRERMNGVDEEIRRMECLEKPFVAAISAYSGGGETRYETEEQARKKFKEYCGKTYYRNGVSHGAFLYKYNEDGTKTLLDVHAMNQKDFFPYQFDQDAV
jgi:hypothetical protein